MRRKPYVDSAHPQYRIYEYPGFTEHRIENWYLARDGSGHVVRRDSWTLMDAIVVATLAFLWAQYRGNFCRVLLLAVSLYAIYNRSTTVLWESVLAIPPHGFQLETQTGFPLLPLKTTRRFIPTAYLQDIIINEALYGWNVRYYLAFLTNVDDEKFSMEIAYKNIMPQFPILRKVYHSLHDSLIPLQNAHDDSNTTQEQEIHIE